MSLYALFGFVWMIGVLVGIWALVVLQFIMLQKFFNKSAELDLLQAAIADEQEAQRAA